MYKVLLVDDEVLTREAIRQNISWEEAGFLLTGVAQNGKEAILKIEEEQPDVVLTDICMPVMDGLALTAYLYEKYPEIKVIIISGYDDFDYARQAIKYQVSNYILKPITSYELVEELIKVKDKIRNSLEKQYEFEKNLPTLRDHFLNRLVEGTYIKNDTDLQLQKLSIRVSGSLQSVVMLEVKDSAAFWEHYPLAGEELIDFAVANISEEMTENHPHIIFFRNTEGKSVFIFAHDSEEELMTLIHETCRNIIAVIYQYMEIKVCALVGETVREEEDWEKSYHNVLAAKEHKFFLEDDEFIYGTDFSGQKEAVQLLLTQQVDKLVLMIKMNQREEIENITLNIFERLRNSGKEKLQMILMVQNLVLAILISLEEQVSEKGEKYEEEFILQISEYKYLSDVEKWFLEFCISLAEDISNKREGANQKLAVRAMDYIENNYMNVDISLNMICDYLGVSTSHFSAFFKSVTGETFTEALTRTRIKKAKNLFEKSDMMNYEVALSVGYQDPHYFSSIFKKHVGMTPTEYGKRLRRGKKDKR